MRLSPSLASVALLSSLLPVALADVEFTTPTTSTTWTGGTTVTLRWQDSGNSPSLDELASFTLQLCVGSNDDPMCDTSLGASTMFTSATTSTQVTIPASAGDDGDNVYFIRMISVATAGGSVWNYSPRFSMTGMTGTFTTAQQEAQAVGDTDPPATVNTVTDSSASSSAGAGASVVTYTLQTGLTRTAPMQTQPGRSITATTARMQYPTSAYTVFTTKGSAPDVETTITLPWAYSVTSSINTASPAPMPDDSMQKFLNRWKD